MATETDATRASAHTLQNAADYLLLGFHREAAQLYWEAATQAIEETAARVGYQLSGRRQYADVSDLLAPWYPLRRTTSIYSSMSMLKNTAAENYKLGDVWMQELADDIHALFDMLNEAS